MLRQILGRRESVTFYFLVPAIAGFLLGWHQFGPGQYTSIWISVASWILHNEIFWLMGFISLFAVNFVFKNNRKLMFLQLLTAALITLLISRPFFWAAYELPVSFAQSTGVIPQTEMRSFVFFDFSIEFLSQMVIIYGPNVCLWLITCLAIAKYGNFPYSLLDFNNTEVIPEATPTDNSADSTKPTHFLRQLKPSIGNNVLLLKAEKNYVRAVTDVGEDLIYYKFGDAITQFASDGLQVHRSYWISHTLLTDPDTILDSNELTIKNGEKIPVGMTFLRELKAII